MRSEPHKCAVETTWLDADSKNMMLGAEGQMHAVLCCAVLCRAVPCCAAPCCAVLRHAVPCCAVPCRAVLCRAVLCCAAPCCAVLCCLIKAPCSCMSHSIILHTETALHLAGLLRQHCTLLACFTASCALYSTLIWTVGLLLLLLWWIRQSLFAGHNVDLDTSK